MAMLKLSPLAVWFPEFLICHVNVSADPTAGPPLLAEPVTLTSVVVCGAEIEVVARLCHLLALDQQSRCRPRPSLRPWPRSWSAQSAAAPESRLPFHCLQSRPGTPLVELLVSSMRTMKVVLVLILFRSVPCRGTESATLLSTRQDSRKLKIGHLEFGFPWVIWGNSSLGHSRNKSRT